MSICQDIAICSIAIYAQYRMKQKLVTFKLRVPKSDWILIKRYAMDMNMSVKKYIISVIKQNNARTTISNKQPTSTKPGF